MKKVNMSVMLLFQGGSVQLTNMVLSNGPRQQQQKQQQQSVPTAADRMLVPVRPGPETPPQPPERIGPIDQN